MGLSLSRECFCAFFDAFLKMKVIHSPGAAPFNQLGRCGAVDNFLTFLQERERVSQSGSFFKPRVSKTLTCFYPC
jgi:hypothetical protein